MNENNSTLVSVIMPYYNSNFRYFCEAIESVLAQNYKNWELIIVNDGSSNKNKNLLEKYIKNLNNNKISIINLEKNTGASNAYNTGIENSKGEIITLLDADDLVLPWDYEEIIENFNKNPNSLILCSDYMYYLKLGFIKKIDMNQRLLDLLNGKRSPEDILNKIKDGKELILSRVVWKREVFNKIKFDTNLARAEDTDLLVKILNDNELLNKLVVAPLSGYVYRFYPCKNRLTLIPSIRFDGKTTLLEKYKKEENTLGYNTIKTLQTYNNEWKFCTLLKNYLNGGSIFTYIKDTFINFKSKGDRLKSIITLIKTIFLHKFLIPVFGIDSNYLDLLFKGKNRYKQVKIMFKSYLIRKIENDLQLYAKKAFKKVF